MTADMSIHPRSAARLDPSRDPRRLVLYAIGLLAAYVAAVAAFWPAGDDDPDEIVFLFIMLAPTVGALLARWLGPGVIRWGRPNAWARCSGHPCRQGLARISTATNPAPICAGSGTTIAMTRSTAGHGR